MPDKPLRDWTVGSYGQDGRAVSSLTDKEATKQMPTMPKNSLPTGNGGGSGDGSRRNK